MQARSGGGRPHVAINVQLMFCKFSINVEAEERLELPNSAYARFQSAMNESPTVFSLQLSLPCRMELTSSSISPASLALLYLL